MTSKRVSLFEDEEVDLSSFQDKTKLRVDAAPSKEQVKSVSAEAGFSSREPSMSKPKKVIEVAEGSRKSFHRRVAYNASDAQKVQLNIRTTQNISDRFYKFARDNGWSLSQTLENALNALADKRA